MSNPQSWTRWMLLASLLASLAAARTVAAADPAEDWLTRSWQMEDGLPQDSVNAIAQTSDGFLWLGTGAGLARYDGVRFRRFGLRDGLRSVHITALAAARSGALWIGTSGGGVSRWEAGQLTSFGAAEGFPAGLEIVSLAADRDGSVWIGTDKGLVHWRGDRFSIVGEKEGLPHKQIRALLQDAQGTLWVSVIPDGLFRGAGGQFTRVTGDPHPDGVYCLFEDRDGAILAGSDELWQWNGQAWQSMNASTGLPGMVLSSIGQSADGALWVGTRGRGLFRSHAGRFAPVTGLATQNVRAVLSDRDGSVWAGVVSGGLHRFAPRLLHFWDDRAGLEPTTVTTLVEDRSGALWAGTSSRGIQRLEKERFTAVQDAALAPSPIIYCATATSDGAIWLAGEERVFRFQSGAVQVWRDAPIRGEAIRALCADGETLWLGTYASTLLKWDGRAMQVMAPAGSFPGTITSLLCAAPETLWIGTSAGLHRWQNGRIRTWTTQDGLLTGNIRALQRDADGTLWLGTLGGGLARLRDGRFVHFTTAEGLIDDTVSQILADDFGALWLGSNRGLMRVERRELEAVAAGRAAELHPLVFGRNEGMLKEQCFGGTSPTATKGRDGRLYFPTMNGVAEIDPRRLQALRPSRPQVGTEEILVDGRLHPPGAALVIPPGHHRLELAYTAPELRGGEWLQFRYRLEGFERNWRPATRSRRAAYDGLPPGHYAFRVAAADARGQWHEAAAATPVTVRPFFWQTLWFQAGGVSLLVAASGAATWYAQRRKHLRRLELLQRESRLQAELAEAARVALQLAGDLRIAREIQMGMIPQSFAALEQEFGVELAGRLDPAREVGGDLYCAFSPEAGRLVIIMGDVSGKGIPASLFMVRTSTLARMLAGRIREPERILAALNDELVAENPSMMFCTMVCAVFEKATRRLELANAGHTLPILLRTARPPVWAAPPLNPLLGILPGYQFERTELALAAGDTVVLYTDGVSEAFNAQHECYGSTRLLGNLASSQGRPAGVVIDELLQEVRTFSAGAPQSDDIAVLVLRILDSPAPGGPATLERPV